MLIENLCRLCGSIRYYSIFAGKHGDYMGKYVRDLTIKESRKAGSDLQLITLFTGQPFPGFLPGQFLQIRVDGSSDTFLRRPFSVHDYDSSSGELKILVHIVGNGSRTLAAMPPGESVNAIFPLGNSFTMPEKGQKVLLVGGGCGIAPLLYLGRKIVENGIKPQFLLGFRNSSVMPETRPYSELGELLIVTEDGSEGEAGFVTDHHVLKEGEYDRIYCCGPDEMMKAVVNAPAALNAGCEVSLENLMACGFGVCLCCIAETVRGNLCTCTDGPVFNSADLKWGQPGISCG